jgi:hypothetical protein
MKKPFSRQEVFARIEHLLDENFVPRRMPSRLIEQTSPMPIAEAISLPQQRQAY